MTRQFFIVNKKVIQLSTSFGYPANPIDTFVNLLWKSKDYLLIKVKIPHEHDL